MFYLFDFILNAFCWPKGFKNISDSLQERFWEKSLVEVLVLAPLLLMSTAIFEAYFLPRGKFIIILFLHADPHK